MTNPLLSVEGLCYRYPESDWQLSGIDWPLQPGDCVGIVGPNGSGKSTLLKLAVGLLTPQQGHVRLGRRELATLSRRDIARVVGYLPQGVQPSYDHRVADVVGMGRYCRQRGLGFASPEDEAVIARCLASTEMTTLANRPLSQLSGGERQRALLAAVLAQEPEALLLDEPTTGLDLHHQVAFFQRLGGYARDGLAVAVVTHDWNLAAQFCDRLLLLKEGRILAYGSVNEVVRPEMLSDLYGAEVCVTRHPQNDRPVVLPQPIP